MAQDSLDMAAAYAQEALEHMRRRDIPPTPENFAVWYAYVTGGQGELRRAMDVLISNDQTFDPGRSRELYQRYLLPRLGAEAIAAAGDQVQGIVDRVGRAVGQAGEGASAYSAALDKASASIRAGRGEREMAGLVDTLLGETRRMQEQNRVLQDELVRSSREVGTLRRRLEDVRREAETDGLTGIANRKRFDQALREAATVAMERGSDLSLLMIDIDHFKRFNDTHGHQLGDQVLRLVARTIGECVRDTDIAARYGGEEFAVVLPGTPLPVAMEIADRIRRTVATKRVVKRGSGEMLGSITLSAGAARFSFGEKLQAFVERADEALYHAKYAGRNRVCSEKDVLKSA